MSNPSAQSSSKLADRNPSATEPPVKKQKHLATLIDNLIEAQLVFIQQWWMGEQQQNQLLAQFWGWLGEQPLNRYLTEAVVISLINDWALAQPLSERLRSDIRDIAHSLIFHPSNDHVLLSELVDDEQITQMASYIASHQSQRQLLIHRLIGNDGFADLLTQTLYHAINDFMESSLEKAGGVGKLMKLGRSSFEKATNHNLDDKLQAYLHKNIKDLTRRAELNAQQQLSNDEVSRLLQSGWARIKDKPVSSLQRYFDDTATATEDANASVIVDADADLTGATGTASLKTPNMTLNRLEANLHTSYNRLRVSPYAHSLVSAAVQTWYQQHATESIAQVLASYHLDLASLKTQPVLMPILASLNELLTELLHSHWLEQQLRQMLQAFYEQPSIQAQLLTSSSTPIQSEGYPSP